MKIKKAIMYIIKLDYSECNKLKQELDGLNLNALSYLKKLQGILRNQTE